MRFGIRIVKAVLTVTIVLAILVFIGPVEIVEDTGTRDAFVKQKINPGRKIHKLPESEYIDEEDLRNRERPPQELFKGYEREYGEETKKNSDTEPILNPRKLVFKPEGFENKTKEIAPKPVMDGGVIFLSDEDLARIEKRFKKRRDDVSRVCQNAGNSPVLEYAKIPRKTFLFNHIFHEPVLELSGCIPPKTGSTSWNHFWWETSSFDGVGKGKFDSFQSQGNQLRVKWSQALKDKHPKVLFLQTRHPVKRLVSGWNNILCNKNCRDKGRVTYSSNVIKRLDSILTGKLHKPKFKKKTPEDTRMVAFEDWVEVLLDNNLDQFAEFDIHFHSYERACFPCDFPYEYIVRLETFSEDYQFILRKRGLWKSMKDVAKQAGSKKENESVGLDYKMQLRKLSKNQLQKLYEMKKVELDMFGYTFDPETLEMGLRPE